MVPNLLESTKEYWKKLDALEAAYKRGDVSIEEVDVKVAEYMAELGQERRFFFRFVRDRLQFIWQEQPELLVSVGLIFTLTWMWTVVN
ncbi:hypothetical protein [Leptolyngbya ohadii]|uniref:hypothetical protein n=1 Tax=Leptolyngbya ohadii TaxID=1962290 RepID=UPI000B59FCC3|nr:hypothetical protein [Leptolyngbya ohadii]